MSAAVGILGHVRIQGLTAGRLSLPVSVRVRPRGAVDGWLPSAPSIVSGVRIYTAGERSGGD